MNRKIVLLLVLAMAVGIVGFFIRGALPTKAPAGERNVSMLTDGTGVPVVTQEMNYYGDAKGFYAAPAAPGNYPGVVMIHEWWGLNDNIKDMARELAGGGYQVLAVDLYHGEVATAQDRARQLVGGIDQHDAILNMRAAVANLRERKAAKIASLGWCFGGGQSLQLAISGEPLDATVVYYGNVTIDKDKLSAIRWPVLGIFGEKDTAIPAASVREFDATLGSLGVKNEINIYPDVGHAFANPSGMNYAPEETRDAWAKTTRFLAEYLK